MVTQPRGESVEWGQWNQAFLLIAENTADELPKKKDLFKLFASRAYPWDVPAKNIKVQSAPFVFRIALLNNYNHVLIRYGRFEEYSFYIGLVFYYRGNTTMARKYLQWVANHAEKQHYVHTAESILKKLPPQ